MLSKKGQGLGLLKGAAIAFVVVGITMTIGQDIMSDLSADYTDDTYASNATEDTQEGLAELSGWFDTIGLVLAAAVILGVVGFFATQQPG